MKFNLTISVELILPDEISENMDLEEEAFFIRRMRTLLKENPSILKEKNFESRTPFSDSVMTIGTMLFSPEEETV